MGSAEYVFLKWHSKSGGEGMEKHVNEWIEYSKMGSQERR